LTPEQIRWFHKNQEYECLGRPRPDVRFERCGTLHGNGTFEPLQHLVAVKLRSDRKSVLVGVAVKPMSELR
jgi:hypothetical protein